MRSTPPSRSPRICSPYASAISSNDTALNAGSFMSGDSERDLDVGPMLPATYIFLCPPQDSAASRAILAPAYAMSKAYSAQPYSSCDILLALNVLVSMMSAPAFMYSSCIALIVSGLVRLRHSLFPFSSLGHPLNIPEWKSCS